MNNSNFLNHNPGRIILRGDDLPALLLGSTFIDLRKVGENCRSNGLSIEFYQEIGANTFRSQSRFFVGRDFSNPENLADVLSEGVDYRIELCQCIPELDNAHSDRELNKLVDSFNRGEPELHNGIPTYRPTINRGEVVPTIPNFRVYRFELRPPFTEQFILQTHKDPTIRGLYSLLLRFVRFHDKYVPETIQAITDSFLKERPY